MLEAQRAARLIVQSDDFGMCHAVNEGVVVAFESGILTQATVMVPCPWFEEAAGLARRYRIPVGLHSTLTCEWESMRWRPVTHAPSLVRADGTFHETVARAARAARPEEAAAELEAQARTMVERGLPPIYFDTHMGVVSTWAYRHVCERFERPFLLPVVPRFLRLDSVLILSPRPADAKRRVLLGYLEALGPGLHLIQAHPAVASRELRALAAAGSPSEPWAETHRASDLALLVDPEVRAVVERRQIELVSVSDLDEDVISAQPDEATARRAAKMWRVAEGVQPWIWTRSETSARP